MQPAHLLPQLSADWSSVASAEVVSLGWEMEPWGGNLGEVHTERLWVVQGPVADQSRGFTQVTQIKKEKIKIKQNQSEQKWEELRP
jgi:hypothetical protein